VADSPLMQRSPLALGQGLVLSPVQAWHYARLQVSSQHPAQGEQAARDVGLPLPPQGRWAQADELQVAWLRPGCWLLGGSPQDVERRLDMLGGAGDERVLTQAWGLCALDLTGPDLMSALARLFEHDFSGVSNRLSMTTRFGGLRLSLLLHPSADSGEGQDAGAVNGPAACRMIVDASYLDYVFQRCKQHLEAGADESALQGEWM